MENKKWFSADEFCSSYQIEYFFIHSLHESGLIQVTLSEDRRLIPAEQLQELEKFVRLHYDLDINIAGIEAIAHLLERVKTLQREINHLRRSSLHPGPNGYSEQIEAGLH